MYATSTSATAASPSRRGRTYHRAADGTIYATGGGGAAPASANRESSSRMTGTGDGSSEGSVDEYRHYYPICVTYALSAMKIVCGCALVRHYFPNGSSEPIYFYVPATSIAIAKAIP